MNKRKKNCLRKILFAILAISLFYYADAIAQSAGDVWENAGTLSSKRAGCQAHAIDDTIYLIGGVEDSTAVTKVEAYDPVSQIWTLKANLTEGRTMFGSCLFDGKIYVMGGETEDGQGILNSLEMYDPQTDEWTVLAPMSVARSHFSACAMCEKIYAVGGAAGDSAIDTIEEYDPSTNTWTIKTTIPNPRYGSAACVVDNKIIIIGGRTSKQGPVLDTVDEYDPQLDTWTTKGPLLKPRTSVSLCLLDNTIYAIGGIEWDGLSMNLSQLNERYNHDNDTWERMAKVPIGCSSFAVCSFDGRIYTFGGYLGSLGNSTDYIRTYTPPPPHFENQWRKLKNMPFNRDATKAEVINGKAYIIVNDGDIFEFDPRVNDYRIVGKRPIPTGAAACTAFDGQLYVTGGYPTIKSLSIYNPATNIWNMTAADMPFGTYGHQMCVCSGKINAGFGENTAKSFAEYDPLLDVWKNFDSKKMPSLLQCAAFCACSDLIYFFGGGSKTSDVYALHPATETWEQKASLPTPRLAAAACYVNGLIYVIGGVNLRVGQTTNVVEAYDPALDKWITDLESMPTDRRHMGACVIDNMIYVFGGLKAALYSGTTAAEVYKPLSTAVAAEYKKEPVAKNFQVCQNYPNPFNPATTIEYTLPRASYVTLKVYDLLGREVRTLVQEQQSAGAHSVLFEGGELPSNIYFYKLEWDGACEIRKMALLR
ncbi:T9SS type A sorting domain-containing protein [candidate division KSB1 bacterium]|nr:T9SS type A sorting domain-containing protein [candidate division KSB1 bacterium]